MYIYIKTSFKWLQVSILYTGLYSEDIHILPSFLGGGKGSVGDLWTQLPIFKMVLPQPKGFEYKTGIYACKVCGKSFHRQNSCYDHMAFHEGTSKCTICNCVLSQKGNLKRHMRAIHGIDM
jgi:hypothetical protein